MALDPPNASWNDTDCTTHVRVRDVMTQDLRSLAPELTVHDAARKLSDLDVKMLPVCARGTLVGILTDRDIVVRVLATTGRPDTLVRSAMTDDVVYVYEDDDLHTLLERIEQRQIKRVPVVNRRRQLVGVIALADIAGSLAAARWNAAVAQGKKWTERGRAE